MRDTNTWGLRWKNLLNETMLCEKHKCIIPRSIRHLQRIANLSTFREGNEECCGSLGKKGSYGRKIECRSTGKCFAAATLFPRSGKDKQETLLRRSVVSDFVTHPFQKHRNRTVSRLLYIFSFFSFFSTLPLT